MQCVKVWMMKLHLSIFPIYVLLLLISLSQGRPPHDGDKGGGGGGTSPLEKGRWRIRDDEKSLNNPPWDRSRHQGEEDEEDMEEEMEEEDDQTRFRNNILRELGLEDAYIPSTPKELNISREEYMVAYVQYMTNVRRRKEAVWMDVGPKRRRKNAITKTHIFEGEGVRTSGGEESTTTFHFDMDPAKLRQRDIRVRRAEMELPRGCRPLVNATKLTSGEDTYDLTKAVISWLFAPNPSPSFQLVTFCQSAILPSSSSISTSRLRLVTNELPTKSKRSKRSAPTSTLQTFKHNKSRGGIDCSKTRRGKSCCRKSLRIKFTDLGISEVIIEPQVFDAHVCVGRCNAKRVTAYSTTHAMFQHIMHQAKGKEFAPRPCCAPTKLTELDVIHVNSANPDKPKLEVTVLKDAIVEECGCT